MTAVAARQHLAKLCRRLPRVGINGPIGHQPVDAAANHPGKAALTACLPYSLTVARRGTEDRAARIVLDEGRLDIGHRLPLRFGRENETWRSVESQRSPSANP